MTEQEFFAGITGHDSDLVRALAAFRACGQPFCLIGGLAINHYAEPVVTLDAGFAVAESEGLVEALRAQGFSVEEFPHSLNARLPGSRLRIRASLNSRYADFPERAIAGTVFGLQMPVAKLDDLVQAKLWAFQDLARRASKRAKDRADLIRLCETYAEVVALIPVGLIPEVDEMR